MVVASRWRSEISGAPSRVASQLVWRPITAPALPARRSFQPTWSSRTQKSLYPAPADGTPARRARARAYAAASPDAGTPGLGSGGGRRVASFSRAGILGGRGVRSESTAGSVAQPG